MGSGRREEFSREGGTAAHHTRGPRRTSRDRQGRSPGVNSNRALGSLWQTPTSYEGILQRRGSGTADLFLPLRAPKSNSAMLNVLPACKAGTRRPHPPHSRPFTRLPCSAGQSAAVLARGPPGSVRPGVGGGGGHDKHCFARSVACLSSPPTPTQDRSDPTALPTRLQSQQG